MANQRAKGQKLLTLPASEDFIQGMDENLTAVGYSNRSQFIRDAIIEKLQRAGIQLPKEFSLAPVRTGEIMPPQRASSKPASPGKRLLRKAVAGEIKASPK